MDKTENSFNNRSWSSRLISLLVFGLSLQVFAQCLEVYFYGSKINATLFLDLNLEDYLADYIEFSLLGFVLISSFLFLVFRQIFLLIIPALWSLALAATTFLQHASFGYELVLGAHLARILLPIGLFFLLRGSRKDDKIAFGLLRLAIASTFIFHGIEALRLKPVFVDYILEAADLFLAWEMSENTANTILYGIGVVDILVGIAAISMRSVSIFMYMAFWGGITALCRYVYHGDMGILPMLIRSAHWTIPLFLGLAYMKEPFTILRSWRLRMLSPRPQGSEL